MSGYGGYTWVYVPSTNTTYMGQFSPSGGASAHSQLVSAAGIPPMYRSELVGGSASTYGTFYTRSNTYNTGNYGHRDFSYTNPYTASALASQYGSNVVWVRK